MNTNLQKSGMSIGKQQPVTELGEYNSSLTNEAEDMVFSPFDLNHLLPDMNNWSKNHKRIYFLTAPFFGFFEGG